MNTGVVPRRTVLGIFANEMQCSLSLKLPEDFSHIAMVRRVTRDVLVAFGVVPQDVDDIESVLGELATNAVRHARNRNYTVDVALSEGKVVLTVSDEGAGFSRDDVAPPGTIRPDGGTEAERIGGWGLPLIEMLTDHVEFLPNVPHGTIVRAEKYISRGPMATAG